MDPSSLMQRFGYNVVFVPNPLTTNGNNVIRIQNGNNVNHVHVNSNYVPHVLLYTNNNLHWFNSYNTVRYPSHYRYHSDNNPVIVSHPQQRNQLMSGFVVKNSKTSPRNAQLAQHVQNINNNTQSNSNSMNEPDERMTCKKYACNKCGKIFKQKGNLKTHYRTHTGEKPFVCHLCHKSFTQSGHLQNHLLIHKGQKPFKCSICHKEFRQSSNLKQHQKKHQ